MTILVTGSAGFIAGYLVQELLDAGHRVIGMDNYSKYGRIEKSYQKNPNYRFVEGDARDTALVTELVSECDHFVACAARIGGITYFHEYAYDLLAENERIIAASFDAAIAAHKKGKLQKITVLSSSMVFENATVFPTPEGHERAARRRRVPTAFRSWPASTSRRALGSNTSCPTRSAGRSTASASANAGRSAIKTSRPATLSLR